MKAFSSFAFSLILVLCFSACQNTQVPDLILINGNFLTVDSTQATTEAIAIKDHRIIQIGSTIEIQQMRGEATQVIDLKGQFAMPGFIEGHGHFSGLGKSLINLNFLNDKSWEEVVQKVAEKAKTLQPGEWIEGRGWHQEKWTNPLDRQYQGYPYHDQLSEVSPNNPVILYHASGHSLFANEKAMQAAGINLETPNPSGGEIVRDPSGNLVGVFEERAMNSIYQSYQEYLKSIPQKEQEAFWYKAIDLAQKECLAKGITSFQDAGSSFIEIERYKKMAEEGKLDLRLWAMVRHSYEKMKSNLNGFPIIDAGNYFFSSRAIKTEVDGALGSYGAWLLKSYHDKPHFHGQNTTPIEEVDRIAGLANKHNLQLCVHAIGDRANREVLNIFEKEFQNNQEKKDWRWRIEHAQHLSVEDIPRFKELEVIASIQGVHCTSDAPFVVKRLGEERAREGAYAWRSLLDNGVKIANGTDAPVEDVSALESFYASVTRKRKDTGLEFFTEQKMTRMEGIHSYTLGNAYAAFEEKDKGSLVAGKLADIVVLSKNLLTCPDDEILDTKVLYTIVGGKVKYKGDF